MAANTVFPAVRFIPQSFLFAANRVQSIRGWWLVRPVPIPAMLVFVGILSAAPKSPIPSCLAITGAYWFTHSHPETPSYYPIHAQGFKSLVPASATCLRSAALIQGCFRVPSDYTVRGFGLFTINIQRLIIRPITATNHHCVIC